jgi:hypothetical protein
MGFGSRRGSWVEVAWRVNRGLGLDVTRVTINESVYESCNILAKRGVGLHPSFDFE